MAIVSGVLLFILERARIVGAVFDDGAFVAVSDTVSAVGAPVSITVVAVLIVVMAVTWVILGQALARRLRCAECGGPLRGIVVDEHLLRACEPCGFAWDMGRHATGDHAEHHHHHDHHHHL